MRVRDM